MNAPVNHENRDSHGDPQTRFFCYPERGLTERSIFLKGTTLELFFCAPLGGGGVYQSCKWVFLTTFPGDFGPLGGVTHFPASRQACMKCFEGGRGVFSRVPRGGTSSLIMSQTQKPGNPGVLRYIPDQTGVVSGPKKVPKILGRAGSDSGWQRCQNGSGPARPGPASQTLTKRN